MYMIYMYKYSTIYSPLAESINKQRRYRCILKCIFAFFFSVSFFLQLIYNIGIYLNLYLYGTFRSIQTLYTKKILRLKEKSAFVGQQQNYGFMDSLFFILIILLADQKLSSLLISKFIETHTLHRLQTCVY